MPSSEREPHFSGRDHEPRHEEDPVSYQRAARFGEDRLAARVYSRAQDAIHDTPCDLSVYRLLIDRVSHVAVVGTPPPAELDQELAMILAPGEPANLPAQVLALLSERRRQAGRLGPWVERHHRPGQPL